MLYTNKGRRIVKPSLAECEALGLSFGFGGGGVVASFLPTSLVGCAFWLRADLGVSEVGGVGTGVSAWADQSGSGDAGRNAAQATLVNRPPLVASDANFSGQAIVSCTWASPNDRYLKTGTWSAGIANDWTFFAVARSPGSGATGRYLLDNSGTNLRVFADSADTNIVASDGAGGFAQIMTPPLHSTPTSLIVGAKTGQAATLRQSSNTPNGSLALDPGAFSATAFSIGNYWGGGPYCDWDIAEIAMWPRQLTAPECAQLNAYAAARYGLTIAP